MSLVICALRKMCNSNLRSFWVWDYHTETALWQSDDQFCLILIHVWSTLSKFFYNSMSLFSVIQLYTFVKISWHAVNLQNSLNIRKNNDVERWLAVIRNFRKKWKFRLVDRSEKKLEVIVWIRIESVWISFETLFLKSAITNRISMELFRICKCS